MPDTVRSPSITRRLAAMVYEGMLLFGVLFIAGWLFGALLQQRHALYLRTEFEFWLFFVIGAYFVWFWSHGGQTLAMKTWHIRLVAINGSPVTLLRAGARYILSWLWIVPGLLCTKFLHASGWMLVLVPAANVVVWAALSRIDPARQFIHDRLAGTRLVCVDDLKQIKLAL